MEDRRDGGLWGVQVCHIVEPQFPLSCFVLFCFSSCLFPLSLGERRGK